MQTVLYHNNVRYTENIFNKENDFEQKVKERIHYHNINPLSEAVQNYYNSPRCEHREPKFIKYEWHEATD